MTASKSRKRTCGFAGPESYLAHDNRDWRISTLRISPAMGACCWKRVVQHSTGGKKTPSPGVKHRRARDRYYAIAGARLGNGARGDERRDFSGQYPMMTF